MGGGWVGYIFAIMGCGVFLALIAGSTAVLYAWAKVQRRRGKEPTAQVSSLASRPDDPAS